MSIYIVRVDTAEGYSFGYTHADIREAHRRFEEFKEDYPSTTYGTVRVRLLELDGYEELGDGTFRETFVTIEDIILSHDAEAEGGEE